MFGPNVPRCGFPFISTAFRRHGDHEQKARTEDHSDADPTGNFLYVAHTVGGAITGYVINPPQAYQLRSLCCPGLRAFRRLPALPHAGLHNNAFRVRTAQIAANE